MKTRRQYGLSGRIAAKTAAAAALACSWAEPALAQVFGGSGIQGGLSVITGVGGIADSTTVIGLVTRIINFILNIVLIMAVLAIIVAGVYLIVSGGNDEQKDKAKKIVLYAVIGIIVILLSRVIVIAVNTIFT